MKNLGFTPDISLVMASNVWNSERISQNAISAILHYQHSTIKQIIVGDKCDNPRAVTLWEYEFGFDRKHRFNLFDYSAADQDQSNLQSLAG